MVNDVVQRLYPKSDQSPCLLSQARLYSHSSDWLKTWSFQADDWRLAKAVNELSNLWDIGNEANSVFTWTVKFCTVVQFRESKTACWLAGVSLKVGTAILLPSHEIVYRTNAASIMGLDKKNSIVDDTAFAWCLRSCLERCNWMKELEIPKKSVKCRCYMVINIKKCETCGGRLGLWPEIIQLKNPSYVVPSDSVCIILLIAASNDLYVKATLLCG
jgi:hypothetical protein